MAVEIERRFVMTEHNWSEKLKHLAPKVYIVQGYLTDEVNLRVRHTMHELTGEKKGYMTLKTPKEGMGVNEIEFEINEGNADSLLAKDCANRLHKYRQTVPIDGYVFEIDLFAMDFSGMIVAEVEFPSEEEAKAFNPADYSWLGTEITEMESLSNRSMLYNFSSYEHIKNEFADKVKEFRSPEKSE